MIKTILMSWNKSNIIQSLIAAILFATLLIGGIGLCTNNKYYRNSLRPYVKCVPANYVEIEDGSIRFNYYEINKGKTPAYEIASYSTPTNTEEFPETKMIEKMGKDSTPIISILFPEDTLYGSSGIIGVQSKVDGKSAPKQVIEENIISGIDEVFLHFYLEYSDVNREKYYYRMTLKLHPSLSFKENQLCSWTMIDVSEEKILE